MKVYNHPKKSTWSTILERPTMDTSSLEATVQSVLQDVKTNGDQAVKKYTFQFDKVDLATAKVSPEEVETAVDQLDTELKAAIITAQENIKNFHAQQSTKVEVVETMPGVRCWRKNVGIEKVGLYIPGGTAPLFSTVLMLGIPAKLANCKEIILCSPPQKDGSIHPAILFAANLVGITQIFKIGGVQAVAAMAYGTETVPQVFKIFGPGNQYVTAAKQLINKEGMAIDMPAGPSEVLVYADESSNADFVAADLLSQAEHGIDSQVVLISTDTTFIPKVQKALARQLATLPRQAIAEQALDHSVAVTVKDKGVALDIINEYAPEHLILATDDALAFAENIINAGSVFLGHYTPESVGDYASGTNHTLPTNGFAKAYSGVSLDSFVKKITFQQLSAEGLQNLGPTVEKMAAAEELQAHKEAVSIRLKNLS